MSALVEFLFPAPAAQKPAEIVRWWEARRLHYNMIVGASGTFSLGVITILMNIPPRHADGSIPVGAVIAFGIMANVCYTFGAAAEIFVRKLWGRQLLPVGPMLFRAGLTFSIGLTLLPIAIAGLDLGIRVIQALF